MPDLFFAFPWQTFANHISPRPLRLFLYLPPDELNHAAFRHHSTQSFLCTYHPSTRILQTLSSKTDVIESRSRPLPKENFITACSRPASYSPLTTGFISTRPQTAPLRLRQQNLSDRGPPPSHFLKQQTSSNRVQSPAPHLPLNPQRETLSNHGHLDPLAPSHLQFHSIWCMCSLDCLRIAIFERVLSYTPSRPFLPPVAASPFFT